MKHFNSGIAAIGAGLFGLAAAHAATYNFYFNNTEQGDHSTATPSVTVTDGKMEKKPGAEPSPAPAAVAAQETPPPAVAAPAPAAVVAAAEPSSTARARARRTAWRRHQWSQKWQG